MEIENELHALLPLQVLCDREEVGHGTIHPAVSFDPDADAAALRKAMKKFGECVKVRVGRMCSLVPSLSLQFFCCFSTMQERDWECMCVYVCGRRCDCR